MVTGGPKARRTKKYPYFPLKQKKPDRAEIEHRVYDAIQYEFYIPAKVWTHRAIVALIANFEQNLVPGATVLKTANGRWEGMEEDTNIYRTIVNPKEPNSELTLRRWIQEEVAKAMAILAEWYESRQRLVLFTETKLTANHCELLVPMQPPKPKEPDPLSEEDADEQEQ
jgi:hypothetical protein